MWKHLTYFSKVKPVVAELIFNQVHNFLNSNFSLKNIFATK